MPYPKLPLDPLAMLHERASTIAKNFDLRNLPPDFYANQYPVYEVLRETSPVRPMPDGSYFLTRHADLVAVCRDAHTFSSDKKVEFEPKYGAASPLFEHHTTSLVFNDPPPHTRVRSRIIGALTRRAIAGMESSLITLVDSLLDDLQTRAEMLLKQELLTPDSDTFDGYLIPVIDEFLCFEPSNQLSNRRALKYTHIVGVPIAAGSLLTLCIGAANRDPAQFDLSNELMLERQNNRHLAFGLGIHQCSGMSLARLEGRIAIGRFLQRFPDYRLTTAPTRGGRARFRGFLRAPFSTA